MSQLFLVGTLQILSPSLFILQIETVKETFPSKSKDDIALVLQMCDYSLESALTCLAQGKILDVYCLSVFSVLVKTRDIKEQIGNTKMSLCTLKLDCGGCAVKYSRIPT